MAIRLPTVKGVPQWIPSKTTSGRYGETVQLYKAIVGGKTVDLPRGYIERELKFQEEYKKEGYSKTMEKKLSRAQTYTISQLDEAQFEQFIAKMPNIVSGMVALKEKGVKLPPGFERRLNLIIKKIKSLSAEERAEFYFENTEEFSDTTDWYHLSKKYAHKPSELFSLDEKDLKKLKEKGFNSYEDFVNSVYDDLGTLNDKLNEFIRNKR